MGYSVPMSPLLRCLACLLLFTAALMLPAPGEELQCRVFRVPPDFVTRGQPAEPEAAPADPSANAPEANQAAQRQREAERLASFKRFPHIIPALGPEPPFDVRPMLDALGVTTEGKALALLGVSANEPGHFLFVRNTQDQLDLIETLLTGLCPGIVSHARVTFRWEEKFPSGRTRLLLERTLLCRGGQRAKFQRHHREQLVEEIEVEVTLGEDDQTVDVNSTCDLTCGKLHLKTQQSTLVTAGDPVPRRLATARGTRPGSLTELGLLAERCAFIPTAAGDVLPGPPFAEFTRAISSQIAAAEQQPPVSLLEKGSDLFWMPELWRLPEDAKEVPVPSLASIQSARFLDARSALAEKGVALETGDRAWYAPQSRLLYLHAGHKARSTAAGLATSAALPVVREVEAAFEVSREQSARTRTISTRTLLIRRGLIAKQQTPIQGAPDEQLEAEASIAEDGSLADFNVAFNHWPVGRDTWSLIFLRKCRHRK